MPGHWPNLRARHRQRVRCELYGHYPAPRASARGGYTLRITADQLQKTRLKMIEFRKSEMGRLLPPVFLPITYKLFPSIGPGDIRCADEQVSAMFSGLT